MVTMRLVTKADESRQTKKNSSSISYGCHGFDSYKDHNKEHLTWNVAPLLNKLWNVVSYHLAFIE